MHARTIFLKAELRSIPVSGGPRKNKAPDKPSSHTPGETVKAAGKRSLGPGSGSYFFSCSRGVVGIECILESKENVAGEKPVGPGPITGSSSYGSDADSIVRTFHNKEKHASKQRSGPGSHVSSSCNNDVDFVIVVVLVTVVMITIVTIAIIIIIITIILTTMMMRFKMRPMLVCGVGPLHKVAEKSCKDGHYSFWQQGECSRWEKSRACMPLASVHPAFIRDVNSIVHTPDNKLLVRGIYNNSLKVCSYIYRSSYSRDEDNTIHTSLTGRMTAAHEKVLEHSSASYLQPSFCSHDVGSVVHTSPTIIITRIPWERPRAWLWFPPISLPSGDVDSMYVRPPPPTNKEKTAHQKELKPKCCSHPSSYSVHVNIHSIAYTSGLTRWKVLVRSI